MKRLFNVFNSDHVEEWEDHEDELNGEQDQGEHERLAGVRVELLACQVTDLELQDHDSCAEHENVQQSSSSIRVVVGHTVWGVDSKDPTQDHEVDVESDVVEEPTRLVLSLMGLALHNFNDDVDVLHNLLYKGWVEEDGVGSEAEEPGFSEALPPREGGEHVETEVDEGSFINGIDFLKEILSDVVFLEVEHEVPRGAHAQAHEVDRSVSGLVVAAARDDEQVERDRIHAMVEDLTERACTLCSSGLLPVHVVEGLG